jgi:hypothetical protein
MPKNYITGADVLRALADGKKVRRAHHDYHVRLSGVELILSTGTPFRGTFDGDWEIVEEPATDAELVAEMRRLAARDAADLRKLTAAVYAYCADMLEKRSIKL